MTIESLEKEFKEAGFKPFLCWECDNISHDFLSFLKNNRCTECCAKQDLREWIAMGHPDYRDYIYPEYPEGYEEKSKIKMKKMLAGEAIYSLKEEKK